MEVPVNNNNGFDELVLPRGWKILETCIAGLTSCHYHPGHRFDTPGQREYWSRIFPSQARETPTFIGTSQLPREVATDINSFQNPHGEEPDTQASDDELAETATPTSDSTAKQPQYREEIQLTSRVQVGEANVPLHTLYVLAPTSLRLYPLSDLANSPIIDLVSQEARDIGLRVYELFLIQEPRKIPKEGNILEPRSQYSDFNMGVPLVNKWFSDSGLTYELPLQDLHPADITGTPVIGIEAAYFLEQFRQPPKEPLVPALGGDPLALENFVTRQVKNLEKVGIKVWFYFDGLETSFDDAPHQTFVDAAQTVSDAFDIYEKSDATRAIERFRLTDYPDMARLYRFLKGILHRNGISFVTAPYRALAQIKYHLDQDLIQAVYASTEAFLYGIRDVMIKVSIVLEPRESIDRNGQTKKELEFQLAKSTYTWLDADKAISTLRISPDVFHDALLLAGNSYIETFPPFANSTSVTFRTITDLLSNGYMGDINALLDSYARDETVQKTQYIERFRKAFVCIDNMPVLLKSTIIKPRSETDKNLGKVPRDLHEVISLVLPPELYFYMYMGMIGPRILNWLTKGQIKVQSPMAGGRTPQYQKLVKEKLRPLRYQSLACIAYSINRWFLTQGITTTMWFETSSERVISKELDMEKNKLATWRVNGNDLFKRAEQLKITSAVKGPGSLYFALGSLVDKDFAKSTISPKNAKQLTTVKEVVSNSIWRFLYLRQYIGDDHQLTDWGRLLTTVLEELGSNATKELAEAAFVAVELLRLDVLNVDELVPGGGPSRGNDTDKLNSILVSRVACVGKMNHPQKGYSGPLSRSLLAFHSLVSEVRNTLRDLLEAVTATLFLEGQAERKREDYPVIAEMLPFQQDWSDGLGVLTMTYLDEIASVSDVEDATEQKRSIDQTEMYLIHTDVTASFKDAFRLWKAVAEGVRSSGQLVDDESKQLFAQVNDWLVPRTNSVV